MKNNPNKNFRIFALFLLALGIFISAVDIFEKRYLSGIIHTITEILSIYSIKNFELNVIRVHKKRIELLPYIIFLIVFIILSHNTLLIENSNKFSTYGFEAKILFEGSLASVITGILIILFQTTYEELIRLGLWLYTKDKLSSFKNYTLSASIFSLLHIDNLMNGPKMYPSYLFLSIQLVSRFISGIIYLYLLESFGILYAIISHFVVDSVFMAILISFDNRNIQIFYNILMFLVYEFLALLTLLIINRKKGFNYESFLDR